MKRNDNVLISILDVLNVKYTTAYAEKLFNEHPHNNNLFGLSDMLNAYNIENTGIRIENTKDNFNKIPRPFIAHLKNGFVAVEKSAAGQVHYVAGGKKLKLPVDEFLDAWSGYAVIPDGNANAAELDYKKHLLERWVRILFAGLVVISLCALYIRNGFYTDVRFNLILCLNLAGVCTGYLLLLKQMHFDSPLGDKICSAFRKSDCNGILSTRAAKLFGVLGLSEIGAGYFGSNVLLMLLAPGWTPLLLLINVCSLPFTFWSFWYQRFRAKQWCPLCLIVLVILWALFTVSVAGKILDPGAFSFTTFVFICIIYAVFILGIHLIAGKFSLARRISEYKRNINKIKAEEDVFYSLLKNEPHYDVEAVSDITFGNPEGDIKISVITNPHCAPCARMHKEITRLLQKSDRIRVKYLFTSFSKRESSSYGLIAAYARYKDSGQMGALLDEWFDGGKNDPVHFFQSHGINYKNSEAIEKFVNQYTWIRQQKLKATPTVLINGHLLPGIYNMKDIGYII